MLSRAEGWAAFMTACSFLPLFPICRLLLNRGPSVPSVVMGISGVPEKLLHVEEVRR